VSDTFGQEIKQELNDERKALEEKYTHWLSENSIKLYEEQLAKKQQELAQLDSEPEKVLSDVFAQYAEKVKKYSDEHTQIEKQMQSLDAEQYKQQRVFLDALKSFLSQVDWKHIQSVSQKYNEYNEQIRTQEKDIQSLEAAITQGEETKKKLQGHRARLEEKCTQQEKLKSTIEKQGATLHEEQHRMAAIHPTALTDHKKWIHDVVRSFEHVAQLVGDYADTKRKLKQLEERE
jgi:DNA repair exonuclease SbcCD ATPase subunit